MVLGAVLFISLVYAGDTVISIVNKDPTAAGKVLEISTRDGKIYSTVLGTEPDPVRFTVPRNTEIDNVSLVYTYGENETEETAFAEYNFSAFDDISGNITDETMNISKYFVYIGTVISGNRTSLEADDGDCLVINSRYICHLYRIFLRIFLLTDNENISIWNIINSTAILDYHLTGFSCGWSRVYISWKNSYLLSNGTNNIPSNLYYYQDYRGIHGIITFVFTAHNPFKLYVDYINDTLHYFKTEETPIIYEGEIQSFTEYYINETVTANDTHIITRTVHIFNHTVSKETAVYFSTFNYTTRCTDNIIFRLIITRITVLKYSGLHLNYRTTSFILESFDPVSLFLNLTVTAYYSIRDIFS